MTKSLQDQLLNAGLIDTKKAKKISRENRKEKKEKIRRKDDSPDETQAAVLEAQREKLEKDRKLNLELKKEADQKALLAQVSQLIDHYKLKRESGDLEYNFKDQNKIKKIRVTPQTSEEIARGRLCIARRVVVGQGDTYEVIPRPIADKIRQRDPSSIVLYNTRDEAKDVSGDSDADYYAQFEIPDDLVW